ncbi:hypothetical protein [Maridesulfovibrio sp.]|uniref:hypothetical protein n=1 Tax=Maridesulfovibrio sp. TaxID=2795000 RepID=UPI002AA5FAA4|nr:hypothetical protein [Maridesulfovibrio sp.]
MTEMLIASIALIIFAFIIYTAYSGQNAKHAQRLKAYELKETHMNKSMEKIRSEISLIEKEISETEQKLEDMHKDS